MIYRSCLTTCYASGKWHHEWIAILWLAMWKIYRWNSKIQTCELQESWTIWRWFGFPFFKRPRTLFNLETTRCARTDDHRLMLMSVWVKINICERRKRGFNDRWYRAKRLTIFPFGVLFWPIIPTIDTHKEECRDVHKSSITTTSCLFWSCHYHLFLSMMIGK